MKKMVTLFGVVFLSIHSMNVNAFYDFKKKSRECTKVDLRGSILGEVRHQGNVGWCFAHSTADLVSYRLQKKISPVDIAINFYDKMPEMPRTDKLSTASGGNDMGAVSYSTAGYCEEELTASENYQIDEQCRSLVQPEISSIVIFMENLFERQTSSLSYCQKNIISSLFKNISEEDLNKVARLQKSSLQKISLLKDLNCQGRRVNSQKIVMRGGLASDALVDIDEQLNSSNPISLNYDAAFIYKGSTKGSIYNHYSTIVGRRVSKESNTCQYLIRNSWGPDCSIYPAPYDRQCEKGNIWVDEDILRQSIIGIKFLK